eukprot:gene2896-3099_t
MEQLNNTYVFVTSDHGYNLGHHMMVTSKMQFYEHSLRIPMLFMGPGIRRNSTFDWLGTQVDLAPTILGLAGIDAPSYIDGKSFAPLLVNRETAAEQGERLPASSDFAQPYMHLLFNLSADAYELNNIYNSTKATTTGAALVASLEAKLRAYATCKGKHCP